MTAYNMKLMHDVDPEGFVFNVILSAFQKCKDAHTNCRIITTLENSHPSRVHPEAKEEEVCS